MLFRMMFRSGGRRRCIALGATGPVLARGAPGEERRDTRLKNLPKVQRGEEALNGALKRAYKSDLKRVSALKKSKQPLRYHPGGGLVSSGNAKSKTGISSLTAQYLDSLTKELCVPLGNTLKQFPQYEKLHPFEQQLLSLSLGEENGRERYERAIENVNKERKKVVAVGKNAANAFKNVKGKSKAEIGEMRDSYTENIKNVWKYGCTYAIEELLEVVKVLRKLPEVEFEAPTLALVGAPNVGKSSLVRRLSSGKPEVREYPFTTKGIIVGHFDIGMTRHQVTDTPGLLNRKDEERNAMEKLTLSSLKYLPTAVLFVVDPTATCGTTTEDQLAIKEELKELFPGKMWIDVLSKADLVGQLKAGSIDQQKHGSELGLTPLAAEQCAFAENSFPDAFHVSAVTNHGIDELKREILAMYGA